MAEFISASEMKYLNRVKYFLFTIWPEKTKVGKYKCTNWNILGIVLTLNLESDELLMLFQWSIAASFQHKSTNLFDQRKFVEFFLIQYIHLIFIGFNNDISSEDDFIVCFKNELSSTLNQTVFEFLMMEFVENF